MGQTCAVGDVFDVGEGFGVGLGDAWAMVLLTEGDDVFGCQFVVVDICRRDLRDIVVLTMLTAEVAACTGYGEACGARMEMVEGLLLDGVDG